jgi:hypothetical protein
MLLVEQCQNYFAIFLLGVISKTGELLLGTKASFVCTWKKRFMPENLLALTQKDLPTLAGTVLLHSFKSVCVMCVGWSENGKK